MDNKPDIEEITQDQMGESERFYRDKSMEILLTSAEMNKIIEAGWAGYVQMVYQGRTMPANQEFQTKQAFFAGVQHCYGAIFAAMDIELSEDKSELVLKSLQQELDAWVAAFNKVHHVAPEDVLNVAAKPGIIWAPETPGGTVLWDLKADTPLKAMENLLANNPMYETIQALRERGYKVNNWEENKSASDS